MKAFIKGVDTIEGRFHPFVESHDPCVGGHSTDHKRCIVVQRFVGPGYDKVEDAIVACEASDTVLKNGEVVNDWERPGS